MSGRSFAPLDAAAVAGMSGLEILRAILAGELPEPPIRGPMNFWLHAVEEGRVEFRGIPEAQHLNPMGGVHGGWYGTLQDSALGSAVMSVLPAGRLYTTLEYKVNLIRAVPVGTEVAAVGLLRHAGRSTGVADAELRGVADGRLHATGSTTCLLLGA